MEATIVAYLPLISGVVALISGLLLAYVAYLARRNARRFTAMMEELADPTTPLSRETERKVIQALEQILGEE